MASSMRIEKRKPKKTAAAAPKAKVGSAAAAAAALFAHNGKAKKEVANGNGIKGGVVAKVQRPTAPPRYPVKAEDVMDDSSDAGDNMYLEDDIKHGAATHDDHLLAELEERGDADSICEDVIGSSVEDRFFPDIPGSCTPMDAMRLRRLLREVGPTEFVSQTVESGAYTAKKLLTAFSVRPPEFLEGAMDEDYLPFLSLAVTRELQKRAKLFQYNTVDDAVSLLKRSKNIVVLTGAGISTSLGIPDFRSKDIGLYSMLGDLGLDDPQQVFELSLFHEDPSIFYSVARKVLPNHNRCSPTHAFIALLQQKGKLLTNYTQNIDNIEEVAGIDPERLVQCHGSWSTATCTRCGHRVPGKTLFPTVEAGGIPRCLKCAPKGRPASKVRRKRRSDDDDDGSYGRRTSGRRGVRDRDSVSDSDPDANGGGGGGGGGVMKPDITFFGEQLPRRFGERLFGHDRDLVDLVIVIGTSLKVKPVSELVPVLPAHVPQIYISRDAVSHAHFDIDLLGDCDVVVAELCRRAGWDLNHEMVPPGEEVDISLEEGYWSRHRFRALNKQKPAQKTPAPAPAAAAAPAGTTRRTRAAA
ncbi:hypothetical protein RB594_001735 [Gaeumannomyces avenae]